MAHQPVGPHVEAKAVGEPSPRLTGSYVSLQHLEPVHFGQIWRHIQTQPTVWTYMLEGPFDDEDAFSATLEKKRIARDPYTYAVLDPVTDEALGYMALMHWDHAHRTIEVGHVMLSPVLQRTRAATEAFYLVMQEAFSPRINCRRLEWKCNELNAPSKRAAVRLGFTYEGTFRQHYIVKGRNRDTAWYSMLDSEWPAIQSSFATWLAPDNFDTDGQQKRCLQVSQHTATAQASEEVKQGGAAAVA